MVLLRLEQASVVFRQCASIRRHGLTPRAFFLAARNISWGSTQGRRAADNNDTVIKCRRPSRLRKRRRSGLPDATAAVAGFSTHDALPTDPEQQVTIKYFEGDAENATRKEQIDIDATQEFDRELEDTEQSVDENIRALEEDIKRSEFSDIDKDFAEELFTKEERQKIIERIDREWDSIGELPHKISPWEGLAETNHVFLRNLNGALNEVSMNPTSDKARIQIWRWYARCKIYVKDFVEHVPNEAWQLLWQSQSEVSQLNPNRAAHMRVLTEDMVEAGYQLTQEQRYSRLEGMFLDGQQGKALEEWEVGLKNGDAAVPNYLELGIRMHAHHGNVSRSLELLDAFFALNDSWDREVFKSALSLLLAQDDKSAVKNQVRELYGKIVKRFGNSLSMEDYDMISLACLKANQQDLALMVFRDMMLAGDAAKAKSQSFMRQIQDRVGDFLGASASSSKVNTFMLENMSYLPRIYQNKFFFAKWLRKLVSLGELDAAALVMELMYERGIAPDAMHANGLIGAWLRLDTPEARQNAEDAAWAMIQTRLNAVANRNSIQPRSIQDGAEKLRLPVWFERPVPSATIETFCVLLKFYLQNEAFGHVQHLRNVLAYAEIPMNSVFMNHLLYAELHHRTYVDVWQRFEIMSRNVVPDVETWICLWEGVKQEIMRSANPSAALGNPNERRLPKPRHILARMMKWSHGLEGQHLRDALEDMETDTYNDIVRCFCLSRDLTGAFIAMRTMTDKFKVWPDRTTVRLLLLQVAKMGTLRNRPGRRLLQPGKAEVEQNMAKATEVLSLITEHRHHLLAQKGVDFEKHLNAEQQTEETLRTLLQFVSTIATRMSPLPNHFQAQVNAATIDLGIDQMDVDNAMALIR